MKARPVLLALLLVSSVLPVVWAETQLADDSVFYPRNSPEARAEVDPGSGYSTWSMLAFIGVLSGGGYYLLRRGRLRAASQMQVRQRLTIEETKALGNKQYLAVASYGERKFLIGVCPGRIDLLTKLDEVEVGESALVSRDREVAPGN